MQSYPLYYYIYIPYTYIITGFFLDGNLNLPWYIGDEIRRVVQETVIPLFKQLCVGHVEKKLGKAGHVPDTILAEYDQFDDYLEMVIQFGVSAVQAQYGDYTSIMQRLFMLGRLFEVKSILHKHSLKNSSRICSFI